jgi:hypothetical protein
MKRVPCKPGFRSGHFCCCITVSQGGADAAGESLAAGLARTSFQNLAALGTFVVLREIAVKSCVRRCKEQYDACSKISRGKLNKSGRNDHRAE